MSRISNKSILVFLAVILIMAVAGTMSGVIDGLNINYNRITGADTSTGTADVNITSSISFTVSDTTIDFGSMVWNTSCNSSDSAYMAANLSTNGTAGGNSDCLVNGTEDPTDPELTSKISIDDQHIIENDGTTTFNVTVQLTNVTSDTLSDTNISANGFVCGDKDGCPDSSSPFPTMWVSAQDKPGESGACVDTTGASFEWFNMDVNGILAQNEGPSEDILLCANLGTNDGADELEVDYQLQIPYDVYGGDRQATLTYTATTA